MFLLGTDVQTITECLRRVNAKTSCGLGRPPRDHGSFNPKHSARNQRGVRSSQISHKHRRVWPRGSLGSWE